MAERLSAVLQARRSRT